MEQFITKALQDLIDVIKQIAPELWRIAIRQVYAEAARDGIIAILALAIGIVSLVVWLRIYKEDREGYTLLLWVPIIVGFLIFSMNIVAVAMSLINPEYYAMQLIIRTASGK